MVGVVAALRRVATEPVGLLYVDRRYDLNIPASTTDGARRTGWEWPTPSISGMYR